MNYLAHAREILPVIVPRWGSAPFAHSNFMFSCREESEEDEDEEDESMDESPSHARDVSAHFHAWMLMFHCRDHEPIFHA
jgi:hypothetical protein